MGNDWRDSSNPKPKKRRSPMDTGNDSFLESMGCGIVALGGALAVGVVAAWGAVESVRAIIS